MKLYFDVADRPNFKQLMAFAVQQMLAIMTATIAVPMTVGHGLSPSAAMLGAGVGTLVYLLLAKRKSPVFLGSSFTFVQSMLAAFAGGACMALGWLGLILGAVFAGLVYVILGAAVKYVGVKWVGKLMPAVVIGPTVSIIGLTIAGNAIANLRQGDVVHEVTQYAVSLANGKPEIVEQVASEMTGSPWIALLCGIITLFVTIQCSTYGKKTVKLIPFCIGILTGYAAGEGRRAHEIGAATSITRAEVAAIMNRMFTPAARVRFEI